jgi:hypothetical protein
MLDHIIAQCPLVARINAHVELAFISGCLARLDHRSELAIAIPVNRCSQFAHAV